MGTANLDPPKPISSLDVAWQEYSHGSRFGVRYRHLARAAMGEDYRVGVAIEELSPGNQSAPAHYHLFEEEHVYVLHGTLSVRIGAEIHEMRPGDYVCFPAGQKAGHCLLNNGDVTCRYVMVGEKKLHDVVIYPVSNKVLVRALGPWAILDRDATRDYWEGEDTGLPPQEIRPPNGERAKAEAPVEPKPPIASRDVTWEETREGTQLGGRTKHLTHAAIGKDYNVGVLIESPSPGRRLAPTHYHMLEEEHALILDGQVTLRLGEERHNMKPGDYVCFPAGCEVGHSFLNRGTGPCSYLMIGEHNPSDVCVYPDSDKMAIHALRAAGAVFDMSGARQYWDGERTR